MGVRMVGQCRSPGVEDGGEPDARAEVLGVVGLQPTGLTRGGDGDQGLGGGFEQQVIDNRLILIGDVGDRPRQGEHDMEIEPAPAKAGGTGRSSAWRSASHCLAAAAWHFGQCRLRQEL